VPTTFFLYTVTFDGVDPVPVTVTDRGEGRPILLLHGGMGPQSITAFADLLAGSAPVRVFTPIHPGFDGTPRPERLNSIRGLATLYVELLEYLDLTEVTVIGNSIGGWIAAEIAVLGSSRIRDMVLVDALGIDVPDHPPVDFFGLTPEEAAAHAYHDPAAFRVDPSTLTPEQLAALAGNREALGVYGARWTEPTLATRLSTITTPTTVIWGESDRIVTPDYGRAYAAAIPGARFQLLPATGHAPQIESPALLLDALQELTIPA
jgi:pimeloyl-ACP methyl ester carboxylesterase